MTSNRIYRQRHRVEVLDAVRFAQREKRAATPAYYEAMPGAGLQSALLTGVLFIVTNHWQLLSFGGKLEMLAKKIE